MAFLTPSEITGSGEKPGYNTQNITLDDFLGELRTPREQFGAEHQPQQPAPGNMPDDYSESDATFIPPVLPGSEAPGSAIHDEQRIRKAKYTAKFVVGTIDTGVGNGCKMIAKAKSAKPYQATPEEKADLVEVWAEYLKEVGGDIPPGILVLLTTSVIYTPKLIQAFSDRKLVQQVNDQADEIRKLREQISELTAKKTA